MKKILLFIAFLYSTTDALYAQDNVKGDGVVSFSIPVRNSLKFNRYIINPTFSFVREQNSTVSFYNKRQWVQFDNAPQTYLFSYSGRFRENEGIGVALFQQNYGLMTTFGIIGNFAHNVVLQEDSNLTFGANVGFYKSGLNQGKIITNDTNLTIDNIPSNSLLTINPGINYGNSFLDVGLSVNNLLLYNFAASQMVKDDPEQSVQAHLMYTGYVNTYGFFDRSKFSGILKSEFRKDKTVISGLAMFSIPKGFWAQAGYNTLYGMSAGLGVNITPKIAIEYNYEKGTGNFSNLGASHEFVIAYKFKSKKYYYGDDEDEGGLIEVKNTAPVKSKQPVVTTDQATQANLTADAKAKADAEAKNKLAAETKAKADAGEQARLEAEASLEAKNKLEAETKAKADAETQLRLETQAKADLEAKNKLEAETKAKADAETQLRLETQAKADLEAKNKLEAETKAKADAEALQAKLAADNKAKADAEALRLKTETDANVAVMATRDATAQSMDHVTESVEDLHKTQTDLFNRLTTIVVKKQKDLTDLKEEYDLSQKGIYKQPKPFVSTVPENNEAEALKSQITQANKQQEELLLKLTNLYNERLKKVPNKNEALNKSYAANIEVLKAEQLDTKYKSTNLIASLESTKEEIEIAKKRRIKRAAFENEEDRYQEDLNSLQRIKETTQQSHVPLSSADFDSGDQHTNMQIIKNVKRISNGYYMVIATHNNIAKRDEFLTKAVAAGQSDVNFFYDVNSSKYYIFYDKYDNLQEAMNALELKGNKPYNKKMFIVKVENN
ncbi:PorP/SprF family type IX secretion system membrane protein [Flavobacterium sp. FlaQc-48]|uniref:PorP/SprF family type IX secretion system membrane protein n=1 Tax=Flavobacterium sp. FlaQc-48 TaxID=3374181 RepID=UPI003756AD4A